MQMVLTSELLLEAYKHGLFPMAYSGNSDYVHWVCPDMRGQLPIQDLHISKSLKKTIRGGLRNKSYDIYIDRDFKGVMEHCATPTKDRPETWINESIIHAFCKLHEEGYAHSVEYWEGNKLLGGVYGLKIGGAFFGESMFSRKSNASKIALVHLCARLWKGGFTLLDTQFTNDHLEQFGVYEMPHAEYIEALNPALKSDADFHLKGFKEDDLVMAYLEMQSG